MNFIPIKLDIKSVCPIGSFGKVPYYELGRINRVIINMHSICMYIFKIEMLLNCKFVFDLIFRTKSDSSLSIGK